MFLLIFFTSRCFLTLQKNKTFLGCGKHILQIRLISDWFQAQLYWKLKKYRKYFCVLIATKYQVTWGKHTSDQAPVLHWAGQDILLHGLLISGFSPLQYLLWMERFVPSWRNWTQRTVRIWYPKLPQVLVQCSHSSVIHLWEDKWNVVQYTCFDVLNTVTGSRPSFTVRILNSCSSALFVHYTPLS